MKNKSYVFIFTFILIVFLLGIITIVKQDNEISISERRKLTKFPNVSFESFANGNFFSDFEKYLLDQISFREGFRRIKAINEFYVLNKLDNHKIIIKDGYATKISYPLTEKSINLYIKKINQIQEKYLKDKNLNIYNLVIPDKNYYLIKNKEYPVIDYSNLKEKISNGISGEYIDIFDDLDVDCYYKTDSHWKQEKIVKVANEILRRMNMQEVEKIEVSQPFKPFYGVYYGESALPLDFDEIRYVTTKEIEKAKVYRVNQKTKELEEGKMYYEDAIDDKLTDSYDLFLGGASTITIIENELATSDKTLYLFSDSYGRSLAPLLLSNYKRIVIYDVRYIKTSKALEKVEIEENSDVVFAYSISSIDVSSNIQVD